MTDEITDDSTDGSTGDDPSGPEPDSGDMEPAALDPAALDDAALEPAALDDAAVDGAGMEDAELNSVLEALLLVVDTPVSTDALAATTEQPTARVAAALRSMAGEFAARDSGIDLREAGGGWRMYTRAQFAPYVEKLLLDGARSKLTRAALETLAVVAYRQPVTRARISAVRGVNVDAVIRTLLARGLITEAGTDTDSGAVAFATTELFLERLGLTSLADLPDIAPLLPEIDVIDDLSENLGEEPRFMKLNGAPTPEAAVSFDVDRE